MGSYAALKWSDIDIPNGTLKIDKTIQRIKNTDKYASSKTKIVIDKPKSQKSIRVVPIPSFLHEKLWNQRNRYWVNAYVLSGTYMYVEPRIYQKHFKRVLKEANIKEVNYHGTKAYICDKGNRKRNRCKDVKRNTRAFEYQIYIGKIRTFFRRAEKTEHRETCNMLLVVKTSGQKGKKFIT